MLPLAPNAVVRSASGKLAAWFFVVFTLARLSAPSRQPASISPATWTQIRSHAEMLLANVLASRSAVAGLGTTNRKESVVSPAPWAPIEVLPD